MVAVAEMEVRRRGGGDRGSGMCGGSDGGIDGGTGGIDGGSGDSGGGCEVLVVENAWYS